MVADRYTHAAYRNKHC